MNFIRPLAKKSTQKKLSILLAICLFFISGYGTLVFADDQNATGQSTMISDRDNRNDEISDGQQIERDEKQNAATDDSENNSANGVQNSDDNDGSIKDGEGTKDDSIGNEEHSNSDAGKNNANLNTPNEANGGVQNPDDETMTGGSNQTEDRNENNDEGNTDEGTKENENETIEDNESINENLNLLIQSIQLMNEEIDTRIKYYSENLFGGNRGNLSGTLIKPNDQMEGSFYTYCIDYDNPWPPTGTLYYMNTSEESKEAIKEHEAELQRVLEAGYPNDAFGLSGVDLLTDQLYAFYTQQVVWNIVREDANTYAKDSYGWALYEYAVNGQLPDGFDAIQEKAELEIGPKDENGSVILTYHENTDNYMVKLELKPNKVLNDDGIQVISIPMGVKLVISKDGGNESTEVKENDTISYSEDAQSLYLVSETSQSAISGDLGFAFDSFKTLQIDKMLFTTEEKNGIKVYQRMLGYHFETVSGSAEASKFKFEGGPKDGETDPSEPQEPTDPSDPIDPPEPNEPTHPSHPSRPSRPEKPSSPDETDIVEIPEIQNPDDPEETVTIEDNEVPLSDKPSMDTSIVIDDQPIPLASTPDTTGEKTNSDTPAKTYTIIDQDVPLGNLPQTGSVQGADYTVPALLLFIIAGFAGIAAGLLLRRREREEQR